MGEEAGSSGRRRSVGAMVGAAVQSPGAMEVQKSKRRYLSSDPHAYFLGIAQARSVVRRVIQIVEECAKGRGLESLPHQVLVQVFGSVAMELPVGRIAERLSISQPAASRLVKELEARGFINRHPDPDDLRIMKVRITKSGRAILRLIEGDVHEQLADFESRLAEDERAQLTSIYRAFLGISPSFQRGDSRVR